MKKTIVIRTEEKEIELTLCATLQAMQIYRTEFGSDLIKDLRTVDAALHPNPFADAVKRAGINPGAMSEEELRNKILANLDYSMIEIEDTEPIPDEETQTKTLQIIWAMAKAVDPQLTAFEEWANSLDMQPIRSLAECVQSLWQKANKTTVELKN